MNSLRLRAFYNGIVLLCVFPAALFAETEQVPPWINSFIETALMEARSASQPPKAALARFSFPLELREADAKSTEEAPIYHTRKVETPEKLIPVVRRLARSVALPTMVNAAIRKAKHTYELGPGWVVVVDPKVKKFTSLTVPATPPPLPGISAEFFSAMGEADGKKRTALLSKLISFPVELREYAYKPGGKDGCTLYYRDTTAKKMADLSYALSAIYESLEENDVEQIYEGSIGTSVLADCFHRSSIVLSSDQKKIVRFIIDSETNELENHPQKKQFKVDSGK